MHEIDALDAAYAHDGDTQKLADGASRLMRRVTMHVAPDVAAQTGATWHAFVQTHASDAVGRKVLDDLVGERFRAQPTLNAPALLTALRAWCRNALHAHVANNVHLHHAKATSA